MSHSHKPFYDIDILRNREQAYIETLLKKYRGRTADEALKKEIWDELQQEKFAGRLKIPFKVILKQDPNGHFPPAVEVILDTKV
jgi:hypothetical protein